MTKKNSLPARFFILLIALLMAAVPTMQASAALASCRTDPIFQLSNGDKLTIVLDIKTASSNISHMTYVLHVPAGVTVTRVTYTPGGIASKESYKLYQDSTTPKTYKTDILVTTQTTGSVGVTASARLNTNLTSSANGYSGTYFTISISKP
ncbi:MAG: hypothetical protein ABIU06_16110 [Anaerolineales bacterium]